MLCIVLILVVIGFKGVASAVHLYVFDAQRLPHWQSICVSHLLIININTSFSGAFFGSLCIGPLSLTDLALSDERNGHWLRDALEWLTTMGGAPSEKQRHFLSVQFFSEQ